MVSRGEFDAPRWQVGARQVASIKEALMEVDPTIPVVLQPGNHDIGQCPTPEDVAQYRSRFGDDYFSFWVGGVFYIAINSQYYCDDSRVKNLREEQEASAAPLLSVARGAIPIRDAWLEEQFTRKTRGATHVIVLSHVPPFVGKEEEARGWSNWDLDARERVIRMAEKAGVRLWLAGHYHGNATTKSHGGIEVVVTSSCGGIINWTEDAAYVACQRFPDFSKAERDGLMHRWLTLDDVPSTLERVFERREARPKPTPMSLEQAAYCIRAGFGSG
ncbi:MAG: hypothetical protein SGPRY_011257 [Prymnesium sp.]